MASMIKTVVNFIAVPIYTILVSRFDVCFPSLDVVNCLLNRLASCFGGVIGVF